MARIFILALLVLLGTSGDARAADVGPKPPAYDWPHSGLTGQYDMAAVQRGFQVYRESCGACHSLNLVSYRNLRDLGFSEDEVKAIAAGYTVSDGPDEEGEMFSRPARPSDRFKAPFDNEQQARASNGGALPPDMSLLAKARPNGEDYIVAILTGYEEAPEGMQMNPGMYYNKFFSGHQIAMAPPLTEGQIVYADGRDATVEQAARDVAQFLAWVSEPHILARKKMGLAVLLFLGVFSALLYVSKRKLWSRVH